MDDTAILVSNWCDASQKRSKHAIVPPNWKYHLERIARRDCVAPAIEYLWEDFGIRDRLPAPSFHLCRGRARIFVPALIVPEDPAVRIGHPGELEDVVGERAKAFFALLQSLFRLMSGGNIGECDEHGRSCAVGLVYGHGIDADHHPVPISA